MSADVQESSRSSESAQVYVRSRESFSEIPKRSELFRTKPRPFGSRIAKELGRPTRPEGRPEVNRKHARAMGRVKSGFDMF